MGRLGPKYTAVQSGNSDTLAINGAPAADSGLLMLVGTIGLSADHGADASASSDDEQQSLVRAREEPFYMLFRVYLPRHRDPRRPMPTTRCHPLDLLIDDSSVMLKLDAETTGRYFL